MKGRWAAGIVPRNFCWIVKDRLAVSERPGGYAPYHRRVRRHEEILWLRGHGFTRVVSLLPSQHNLHAYEELGLTHAHFPIPAQTDPREELTELYLALLGWLRSGELVLVHQEELGDRLAGVVAGFLCWSAVLPEPPRAISAVEQLLRRQMGSAGRSLAILALELPPAPPTPVVAEDLALPVDSEGVDLGVDAPLDEPEVEVTAPGDEGSDAGDRGPSAAGHPPTEPPTAATGAPRRARPARGRSSRPKP